MGPSPAVLTGCLRRYDIRTSLIYTWRRELRYARQAVARETLAGTEPALVPVMADIGAAPDRLTAIEVEFSGTVTRIYAGADAGLVATVIKSLRVAP